MCVCVFACVYVCIYVCMYVSIHLSIYAGRKRGELAEEGLRHGGLWLLRPLLRSQVRRAGFQFNLMCIYVCT